MTEVTSGEILVRGRTISTGYYEKSVISDGGKFDDGWLCTSDLATRDKDGFLTVVGRADDVILSGGENVHPEEIESVINSHDGVVESAVFGVPDKVWGQKVVAVLRVETSETFDLEAIEDILRLNLAGYKVPKKWEVVESALPRTASGKLKRFQVAEEFTQQ
jgi:acyl-CoA synthetase (AMP-forming)/AMP-acid ligase II